MQCLIGSKAPKKKKTLGQRKKIIEETTEKEKEKTQGFVKDFLKEIVDEPVEQDTISALRA